MSAMAELEQTGTADEESSHVPPPPPPGAPGGGFAARAAAGPIKPVSPPFVPKPLAWFKVEKAAHRLGLMILYTLFGLGGLVGAVILYQLSLEKERFISVAQEVNGRLYGTAERHDVRRRRRADVEAYDVKYKFTVGGKEYLGEMDQLRVDRLPPGVDTGSSFDDQNAAIQVYYDPDNVSDNRLVLPQPQGGKIIAAVLLLFLPLGLFMAWRMLRYDRYARHIGA